MRLVALSLLACIALFAQTASVTGRITDASGALVPQASISAAATGSGITTRTLSDDQGYYTFPSLQPGVYTLTVSKTGFKPFREMKLELAVQQAARLDLVLEVGAVTETIDVNAQAVLLDSESSTLGQVVENKQVV